MGDRIKDKPQHIMYGNRDKEKPRKPRHTDKPQHIMYGNFSGKIFVFKIFP